MANDQLNAFLAEGAAAAAQEPQQAPPEPTPPPAPQTPPATPTEPPKGDPKPEQPKQQDDGDDEPGDPIEGQPVVARRAYEDERRKRQDYKSQRDKLEGELAALKRQLEEARQPPPPPPQPPQYIPPPPDPSVDPVGAIQYLRQQQQQDLLNERLNMSEANVSERIGADELKQYVTEFKQRAASDPTLWNKLYSQPHPYAWMTREIDRMRLHAEIDPDPAAYRARIVAEERAKWEAEARAAAPPPPVSPAAGLQPSLATARSVAGRSTPTWTGEPSLEDVLAPVQNRKRTNGAMPVRF